MSEDTVLSYTQNRELSWLKFNERVLEEAYDINVPVLERLKFVSIFTNNLDEFFMVRVGSLYNLSIDDNTVIDNKSGMSPSRQLEEIYKAVRPLYIKRDAVYADIETALASYGVFPLKMSTLAADEKKYLKTYFTEQILPILSPQIVDVHHPFPHLNNKAVHIAVMLKNKQKTLMGLIPVPTEILPPIITIPGGGTRFILPEFVILEYCDIVFDMYDVEIKNILCVTRNADINFAEEGYDMDDDYRYRVKMLLGMRRRMSIVRLEFAFSPAPQMEAYFREKMSVGKGQIYVTKTPMKTNYTSALISLMPKALTRSLTYAPFIPQFSPHIRENDNITRQIKTDDLLLHYPFERMEPFLRLIKESANDPAVISIKISIYRLAQKTRLVDYLCAAAENGKEVTALIELRARFDEQNNINWSERLEEAGCNVIYGFDEYKIHAKICLITRKEKGEIHYITQVGTGNYNEVTAQLYTDLSLITADEQIGRDAAAFFKDMAIANLKGTYSRLLVAPNFYKPGIISLIDEQIKLGESGRITIKINSLTDIDIIKKLSEASQAGVAVTLIIRGICCILPGIANKTENIRIISIVGRFLEHSRIYSFGEGDNQKIYISSADLMTRNTTRRVEIACPILDEKLKNQINQILETCLTDTVKARFLRGNGYYEKADYTDNSVDSQEAFMQNAIKAAQITGDSAERQTGFFKRWLKTRLEELSKRL